MEDSSRSYRQCGFAHLDTFDELETWEEALVDPLQISNTPLFKRPPLSFPRRPESRTMLIHDYKGGYNEYESCQGAAVAEEDYHCEYLSFVETFVYFSHRLVTVPPPTWTNACHRHGVKALGTFIVEPDTLGIERIFEQVDGRFWVADKLARIAQIHGFDGWLINIEKPFPILSWSSSKLVDFLKQLRANLGVEYQVCWYDALTTVNVVWYQNTLNTWNLPFALAAGSILTNYAWSPQLVQSAADLAQDSGLGRGNLFFGIDVWAQNVQKGRNKRVTYPVQGGGGTGTGMGMRELARFGISTGIFAPGWSYEHFSRRSDAVEAAMWEGISLPEGIPCDCRPQCPHTAVPYQDNPITKYAISNVSGTTEFFYTNLSRVFHRDSVSNQLWSNIAAQAPRLKSGRVMLYPKATPDDHVVGWLVIESFGGATMRHVLAVEITNRPPSTDRAVSTRFRLVDLAVTFSKCMELSLEFRQLDPHTTIKISMATEKRQYGGSLIIHQKDDRRHSIRQIFDAPDHAVVICGIDIEVSTSSIQSFEPGSRPVFEIYSIGVRPSLKKSPLVMVKNIRLKHDARVAWDIACIEKGSLVENKLPWSTVTGPCAYFIVYIAGKWAGRAHALEFLLAPATVGECQNDDTIAIEVEAISFDGRSLGRSASSLRRRHQSTAAPTIDLSDKCACKTEWRCPDEQAEGAQVGDIR